MAYMTLSQACSGMCSFAIDPVLPMPCLKSFSKNRSCSSRGRVLNIPYYQPLPGIPHTSTPWLCLWTLFFCHPLLIYSPRSSRCKFQKTEARRDGKSLLIHWIDESCPKPHHIKYRWGTEQLRLSWMAGKNAECGKCSKTWVGTFLYNETYSHHTTEPLFSLYLWRGNKNMFT